jgi:hypothetical protein
VLKTMPSQFKLFVVICVILRPTEPGKKNVCDKNVKILNQCMKNIPFD